MKRTPFRTAIQCSLFTLGFILVSIASSRTANAQCEVMKPPPLYGTDYVLVYEQNDVAQHGAFDSAACYLYVASTVDTVTHVTVTCKHYPNSPQTFTLQPRGSISWKVTDVWPDIWVTTQDAKINDRVVMVHGTGNIVCYGMNYVLNTADAFLALPKTSSGSDYRIMSYPNSAYLASPMASQFCVAAFSNGTHVHITPAANTLSDVQATPRYGRAAHQAFDTVLNAGECIQVQTDATIIDGSNQSASDLTGSMVTSLDSAIAVFSGHSRTEIPFNYTRPQDFGTSRDILEEQMPPTQAWGSTYVLSAIEVDAAGTIRPEGDLMRVMALKDGTQVTVNGKSWVTLNAMQYADSLIHSPLVVTGSIGTNPGPILVGEMAHTSTSPKGDNGDPFLAMIPSMDQTYNDFTFFVSDNPVFAVQKVVIAAKAACINGSGIYINNQQIPAAAFKPLPGGQYYILELGVTPGAHRITTAAQPIDGFSILSYGLGYVVSYGYTAGALLVPKQQLIMNDQPKPIQTVYGPRSSNDNRIEARNMGLDDLYLDQAIFTPTNKEDGFYNIRFREALDPENGRLSGGATGGFHLISDGQPEQPVTGTLTIYNHSFEWHDLAPATMQVTYYPEMASASVAQGITTGPLQAELYPNPISAVEYGSMLSFSMPETADLAITIFDELGRAVRVMPAATYSEGNHAIRILRTQAGASLAPGTYRIALRSQKLNRSDAAMLVVQ